MLLVDGLPIFPRVIQYQGEPLALLKQLGFNAIAFPEVPSPEMRQEAARLGLWLVCPPPPPAAVESAGLEQFGPEFDRVLAWDLGRDLIGEQLAGVKRWAEQVRAADAHQHRPLICSPRNDLRNFSRQVDLLLIDRRPLGTSIELTDYAAWVRRQPLLARLGTPVWTTVQTQPNEGLCRQLAALGARQAAAGERGRRADAAAGVHGDFGGEPRLALPFPLSPQRDRPGNAPPGDGPRTAQPRIAIDRALGGGRELPRRGGKQLARGRRRRLADDRARLAIPLWTPRGPSASPVNRPPENWS